MSEAKGDEHKLVVKIDVAQLLCKGAQGCEFYGNPAWDGLCSGCHRTAQASATRRSHYDRNRATLHSLAAATEERKARKEERKVSGLLARPWRTMPRSGADAAAVGAAAQGKPQQPPRPRRLSVDSARARQVFLVYLDSLPKDVAKEVVRSTQHAVDKIHAVPETLSSEHLAEMVQDVYSHVQDRLKMSSSLASTDHSVEEVMEQMETYLTVRAYNQLFCRQTDEEVADMSLCDRIRTLHWVTDTAFLETAFDFGIQRVRETVDEAIADLIDMNARRSPGEKLNKFVNSSKLIFEALKDSRNGSPASADEYLPALIYIILKGNPPLLQSNINFVSRFALQHRIMTGETGYYFTNLCCAKDFVQNMNADSLKMPEEEFEAYTSGQAAPPRSIENCGCAQATRLMEASVARLGELALEVDAAETRLDEFIAFRDKSFQALEDKMTAFSASHPPPLSHREWLLSRLQLHPLKTSLPDPAEPPSITSPTGAD